MPTYLITFSCYGHWLHGDERASIDRNHNKIGTPFVKPNRQRHEFELSQMSQPPIIFNEEQRLLVEKTIREVCEYKAWELLAINVRTNHVHIVVTADVPPENVMNYYKRYASRKLHDVGMFSRNMKIWSRHGSTRYLNHEESIQNTIRYVVEEQ